MTAVKLREWRGVNPVAGPLGTAITTRIRVTPADEAVLNAVAGHLGQLRRADLAAVSRRQSPPVPGLDAAGRRQARRDWLNARKRALTALSSARWAYAIIAANDAQHRRAQAAQEQHIAGLRAAVVVIERRLALPTADMLTRQERAARKKARLPQGYPTQNERFQKQRRLQSLQAELRRVTSDHDDGRARVTEGGGKLARTRHNLDTARLTLTGWREEWEAARWRIEAIGGGDERFGNLTITVTPVGDVSFRLPLPLEDLANAKHGRYVLSGQVRFSYRRDEWLARITGGKPVSYSITRKPGRTGVYLTASWTNPPETPSTGLMEQGSKACVAGPTVGVDLNDGHLAVRRLDPHGNPVGRPERIEFELTGSSSRRDAQVRHAIARLVRYAKRHRVTAIAVEDLNFADARAVGRETMGRGQHGKRFRKSVTGIPTAIFRRRLTAHAHKHSINLWAVNPAYTSVWGDQHWRTPYENVTRHEAAATVIGRRAQGHKARRREGVTRARPEDHAVRATNQAGPDDPAVNTGSRHRSGTRGNESRAPGGARTRQPDRVTATPATAVTAKQLVTVVPNLFPPKARQPSPSRETRTCSDPLDLDFASLISGEHKAARLSRSAG